MIYFNTFLNFNLFYLIVIIFFCKFRSYERSELQVYFLEYKLTQDTSVCFENVYGKPQPQNGQWRGKETVRNGGIQGE